ncbi:hypothetical protein [Erythrobacter sp. WG]|uniref:hypothetical protein n=1 Tax=Erythrobacter sp. WG TaxID=2985510 RepID=UPI0022711D1B|nr:hypothetical protein [Erythrobacter sp. WG]MCX9146633.1 hypothetical protein [Erythrobacter sp. WG]
MQDRIDLLEGGFEIVAKITGTQKEHTCYICSPNSPKFAKGWRVRLLTTGTEVLVGHDCGRRHLGVDYHLKVRIFEAREEAERLAALRLAYLELRSSIKDAANKTLVDQGLQAITDIKEALNELDSKARAALDRAANGGVSGISNLEAFSHGSPKVHARQILRLLGELQAADQPAQIKRITQELKKETDDHNRMVAAYGSGVLGLTDQNVARLDDAMPMVQLTLEGEAIVMQRRTDGLKRKLPLPSALQLIPIPTP